MTPFMRKGRDRGNMKNGKKIMTEIVATTSLPVDRLTAHYGSDPPKSGQNHHFPYLCPKLEVFGQNL